MDQEKYVQEYYERVSKLEKNEKEKLYCEKCNHTGFLHISNSFKVQKCECLIRLQVHDYLKNLVLVKGKNYGILEKYEHRNTLFIQSTRELFNSVFKGYLLNKIKVSGVLDPERFLSYARVDPYQFVMASFDQTVEGLEDIEYLDSFRSKFDLLIVDFDESKRKRSSMTAELVTRVLTIRDENQKKTWMVSEHNLASLMAHVIDFQKDREKDPNSRWVATVDSPAAKEVFRKSILHLSGDPIILENEVKTLEVKKKK